MKVLALMLLLVAVTAAYWNAGEPIRNDPPLPGGLMSGQIGGRSVQIEDRWAFDECNICKHVPDAARKQMGYSDERCKAECKD